MNIIAKGKKRTVTTVTKARADITCDSGFRCKEIKG